MVNRPLTKDEKKFNGAKIAFSKSVAGIDGHPPYKKKHKECKHRTYTSQKAIENGS